MKTKWKLIFVSLVAVVLLVVAGITLYCCAPAIKATIDGNKYYNANEIQNSYDLGYAAGIKTEKELTEQNSYLKTTVDKYYAEIDKLTKQVTALTAQVNDYATANNANQTLIASLQNDIAYYEQLIANLDLDGQCLVTFEFDNEIYDTQVVDKNTHVSVANPPSNDNVTFVGWLLNGQPVDLSTYVITENTRFVADVIRQYQVQFKVDNSVVNTQTVTQNTCADLPTTPTKTNCDFLGWSLDGTHVVNVTTTRITADTVFVAVFQQYYTVTFIANDRTYATQRVRAGSYATVPTNPGHASSSWHGDIFVGWTNVLNRESTFTAYDGAMEFAVNVNYIEIASDTTFYALWTVGVQGATDEILENFGS